MKNYVKVMGGSLLTLAFIFGIGAACSSTAQAQYRDYGQYQRRDRDNDNDRDRRRDWRRNRNWDRNRDRDRNRSYRRNDNYGNYGYGNYGGYGGYNNQYEVNRGYQEGLNTGSSDARRGQSYNPQRSHWYKDARILAGLQPGLPAICGLWKPWLWRRHSRRHPRPALLTFKHPLIKMPRGDSRGIFFYSCCPLFGDATRRPSCSLTHQLRPSIHQTPPPDPLLDSGHSSRWDWATPTL
jgi:hypothetical protein